MLTLLTLLLCVTAPQKKYHVLAVRIYHIDNFVGEGFPPPLRMAVCLALLYGKYGIK